MKIVLHSDDINLLTYWQKVLGEDVGVCDDLEDLYKLQSTLVVLNYSSCADVCEELISKLLKNNNRILMLHRTPDLQTAKKLLRLGIMGYGNALMRDHFIFSAIETIKEDMVWLYPSFTTQLIAQLAKNTNATDEEKLQTLSAREKEVALLLKEGLTYKEIAQKLDITPRTVKAHASKVYEKLGVKDRVSLTLLLR